MSLNKQRRMMKRKVEATLTIEKAINESFMLHEGKNNFQFGVPYFRVSDTTQHTLWQPKAVIIISPGYLNWIFFLFFIHLILDGEQLFWIFNVRNSSKTNKFECTSKIWWMKERDNLVSCAKKVFVRNYWTWDFDAAF